MGLPYRPEDGRDANIADYARPEPNEEAPRVREDRATDPADGGSHGEVIRSTVVIAASSIAAALLSIIRYKALAVLIGPGGVGLFGLYTTILDLAQTLSGLGVQQSGVRQVADAAGAGDGRRIALTVWVVRRASIALGLIGALLLAALALPVSRFTFGDDTHLLAIVLLGVAVLFRVAAAGEAALVQGMRRIGDVARINVASAAVMTVIAIPMVYVFGTAGVAPSLLAMALAALAASWWYSRKIETPSCVATPGERRSEAGSLLGLGLVFMASGVMTLGAAYAIRLILVRLDGLEAAGLYQAAWTIGGLYATFVLQAMGTDFYPRLTAAVNDHARCNRLVNEQILVSILIAGPGLLATLTGADLAIAVLYSGQFQSAAELLRWICLGMALRIVTWPLGFIVIAKGAKAPFFWIEVAATVVHVGLAWLLVRQMGIVGTGLAFLGLYVWHGAIINLIARRMTGFRWSAGNLRLLVALLLTAVLVFVALDRLGPWSGGLIGGMVTLVASLVSLRMLSRLVSQDMLPAALRNRLFKKPIAS